jgi:hypothetical protein
MLIPPSKISTSEAGERFPRQATFPGAIIKSTHPGG